jgi:hypothetical protein
MRQRRGTGGQDRQGDHGLDGGDECQQAAGHRERLDRLCLQHASEQLSRALVAQLLRAQAQRAEQQTAPEESAAFDRDSALDEPPSRVASCQRASGHRECSRRMRRDRGERAPPLRRRGGRFMSLRTAPFERAPGAPCERLRRPRCGNLPPATELSTDPLWQPPWRTGNRCARVGWRRVVDERARAGTHK